VHRTGIDGLTPHHRCVVDVLTVELFRGADRVANKTVTAAYMYGMFGTADYAVDLDDQPLATMIRDLILARPTRTISRRPCRHPDMAQAERDRLDALYLDRGDLEQDVETQARHWLAQYSKILDRTVGL
jgi:hypothetical protein